MTTTKRRLTEEQQELFDGALDVAVQLARSDHEQHKGLGQIIAGLCGIIGMLVPSAMEDSIAPKDIAHGEQSPEQEG